MVYCIALFSKMWLTHYYTWYKPTVTMPAQNWTIPVTVNYGRVVYISPADRRKLCLVNAAFGISLFSAVFYMFLEVRQKK